MIHALHVYCEFMPQSSGVARHMDGLAHALTERCGVRTTVFSSRPSSADAGRGYALSHGGAIALARAVSRCDIVHAHGSRTAISATALRLAWMTGKPTVFTPHCYYQGGDRLKRLGKRLWDFGIERASLSKADAVILLHDGWRDALRDLNFAPRRIDIIPNCIDTEALRTRLDAVRPIRLSGRPALLSVGRLDAIKRIDDMIRALREEGMDQAELHVVGRGDDASRLKALAEHLDLAGRVHFHGWRNDTETAAMMRGCDAMILASEREGLPTVFLEALLARIPMAVSAIDGNLAVSNAVGWPHAFPLGDCTAMARCVRDCLSGPVENRISEDIVRLFGWRSRAEDVAALYRDLLNERGRPV